MGGSVKVVQFKELDSVVRPLRCEASKHMDEVEAEEQPKPYSVSDVPYFSAFVKDGKVVDTSEGVDPPSFATKVARVVGSVKAGEPAAPANLDTVQELAKETGSSEEQIQAQNGLDDALKRRLQKLIDSNRVMLFMKGTPEKPKCRFSKMAVNILKKHKVEFGSFDLLTDNEVLEGIQKYSNWSLLPQIYFQGRARGFRHIGTLMKGCPSESTRKDIFLLESMHNRKVAQEKTLNFCEM